MPTAAFRVHPTYPPMPYLNLDLDYFDHRKTKRLIGLLGRGAEVLPIRLWSYCGKFHCGDGRLTSYTEQEIELLAGWWGKAGDLLPAMKASGFMEKHRGAWGMVSWSEHQGHIAAYREKGRSMAEARWNRVKRDAVSIAYSNAGGDAVAIPKPTVPTKLTDPTVPTKPYPGRQCGFQKPDMPEMQLHAQKIGLPPTEIDRFFNYYEANGWKVGRNPMKSWQAAMVNWRSNYEQRKYEHGGNNSRASDRENPRNVGIVRGPTDYGATVKRQLERQRAEREKESLAGQVVADANNPPASAGNAG